MCGVGVCMCRGVCGGGWGGVCVSMRGVCGCGGGCEYVWGVCVGWVCVGGWLCVCFYSFLFCNIRRSNFKAVLRIIYEKKIQMNKLKTCFIINTLLLRTIGHMQSFIIVSEYADFFFVQNYHLVNCKYLVKL